MIDASAGYLKDGNKNRLRAMDIHKIVDVFNKRLEVPKYSRTVGFEEIEKNDFNLNHPRVADIDALQRYWCACPNVRTNLFLRNSAFLSVYVLNVY